MLARMCQEKKFIHGQNAILEGEPVSGVYLIKEGIFEVIFKPDMHYLVDGERQTGSKKEITISRIYEKETFGFLESLENRPGYA